MNLLSMSKTVPVLTECISTVPKFVPYVHVRSTQRLPLYFADVAHVSSPHHHTRAAKIPKSRNSVVPQLKLYLNRPTSTPRRRRKGYQGWLLELVATRPTAPFPPFSCLPHVRQWRELVDKHAAAISVRDVRRRRK